MSRNARQRQRVAGVIALPAAIVLASGCSSAKAGGGGTSAVPATGASTATAKAVTVDVKNFSFNPPQLTVRPGTTVTWKFEDSALHTVAANDNRFHSASLNNGATFSYTFNKAGTYNYLCSIHQYMTGTVTVR